MSKSYKLKDGKYIDSTGIVHNKENLSNILSTLIKIRFEDYNSNKNLNDEKGMLTVFSYGMPNGRPDNFPQWGVGLCFGNSLYRTQLLVGNYTSSDNKRIAIRSSTNSGSTWTDWQLI